MSKFDQIINSWKEEIESISIDIPGGGSISRKIESINFFPMKSKYYHSEAWKVNFNFMDGIRGNDGTSHYIDYLPINLDKETQVQMVVRFNLIIVNVII